MARYIDADIAKEVLSAHEDRKGYLVGDFEQIIDEEVPSADVVEVVRCKDCKYCAEREDHFGTWDVCTNCKRFGSFGIYMSPNDFCSYGERREDE